MNSQFHNLVFQKKKLREYSKKTFGVEDQKKIFLALKFAREQHTGQRRDEGTPFLIHPVRVAITLLTVVGTWDADIVVSALLHDVLEDCAVPRVKIRKLFGKRASQFVCALTRKHGKKETDKEKEKNKIKKLLQLTQQPLEVGLIKCADFLDNIRCAADISVYSPARQKFSRWNREFRQAVQVAKTIHPVLYQEMKKDLRIFELKRLTRGVIRLGR